MLSYAIICYHLSRKERFMGNKRFGKKKSLGSTSLNRVLNKIKLRSTNEKYSSRVARLLIGYKEYDTQFIPKPKNWKKWRDSQYKPLNDKKVN